MKKERMLKIVLVLIMSVTLLIMSTKVFALSDDDLYLDFSNSVNSTTNTDTGNTNSGSVSLNTSNTSNTSNTYNSTNLTNTTNSSTNTNTGNYNTNLPHAGIEDHPLLIVGIVGLGIVAVYTYTRIKYYKNI